MRITLIIFNYNNYDNNKRNWWKKSILAIKFFFILSFSLVY